MIIFLGRNTFLEMLGSFVSSQESVLPRSVCYPGVCDNQECMLTRRVCYPGVCDNQECMLTRRVC